MESGQSQVWFDIAQKVNALLELPNARDRFRERTKAAAGEWLHRHEQKRQREEERSGVIKATGVPLGSGQADPKNGSIHWLGNLHDDDPPLEAWISAGLSPDLDPDDSLPIPVPKREVSLAERYAALAAVWDARWRGGEKINPWTEVNDPGYPRNGLRYRLLVWTVKSDSLSNEDATVVESWLVAVEADIRGGMPTAETTPNAESEASTAALLRLLSIYSNGIADERFEQAATVLGNSDLRANEKLEKINELMPIPGKVSAEKLGEMLGVSKQAVIKTPWWKQNRKGEVAELAGRRVSVHKSRAARLEPDESSGEDE